MEKYDHKKIEKKWQDEWEKSGLYKTSDDKDKPKCYVLDMFPYPSGEGLHVGHPKGYIATDVYSRYKKMTGHNILHPMGWDAFGLPAENYAIKNKVHPRIAVEKNVARFKEQLEKIGFNYDWEKEVNTTDPEYYRWTQWIFLKLFEKGLAYESNEPINWCPSCQTGLANEDLEGGKCERCGSVVEKKPIRQWVLKITEYADRLLSDLEGLNWPESIKESQKNWIGRSEGALIKFKLVDVPGQEDSGHEVEIFTTRPDTIFGATFLAVSPELAKKWIDLGWKTENEVSEYVEKTLEKRAENTFKEDPEKTGVFSGIYAINPASQEKIPVWIVNYVLGDVGTGAIMAVPAHDERDFEFAEKYDLPRKIVIEPTAGPGIVVDSPLDVDIRSKEPVNLFEKYKKDVLSGRACHTGHGKLINSKEFDGLTSDEANKRIPNTVGGKTTTQYRLKDWVFSRQRYWGEPIPIIHCDKCGAVPVPEKDLPVRLPEVEHYEPSGTGESPLVNITDWINTKCPKCGGAGKRESNTMPQWAGSSWYYLRYIDPQNGDALIDTEKEKYWSPVDVYVGGAEHATRHLVYARFWHKFLFDVGVVSRKEPFERLHHVGLILAEDGRKMSKRYGNVVNPDDVIQIYGADSLRIYEMFMGPFDQSIAWSTDSIIGPRRFIEKVWRLREKISTDTASGKKLEILINKTIKKVGEDVERFNFNTAISGLMILVNELDSLEKIKKDNYKTLLKLVAPFAPHVAEELWKDLGESSSVHLTEWPTFDENNIDEDEVTIGIQINGKPRGSLSIKRGEEESAVLKLAREIPTVEKWLEEKDIKKVIYVKDKIINIVITP